MLRVVLLVCLAAAVHARGAGRAFPIDSENYAIDAFQRINRFLEWDETNFLIDLSGQYANCDNIGRQGFLTVDKRTPDGVSIAAYVDDILGSGSDVNSVNSMVQSVIDDWTRQYGSDIYRQIETADKFGCSVRPGCTGRASVACLFSPSDQGGYRPPNIEEGDIKARAFTEEQYGVAERVMGEVWDRNNTLENLSGWETSCSMLVDDEFHIAHAKQAALQRGMDVEFLYGTARNRGETEPAMVEILKGMKKLYGAKKVGCSIIPDCMEGQDMYVVVGCLFEV